MATDLCQEGIVVKIEGQRVFVKTTRIQACDMCRAKAMCAAFGEREKEIETVSSQDLKVGDKVQVKMEEKLGWIAVFYTFVLPFLCVVLVFFSSISITGREIVSAVLGLAILVPYYFTVFLFRDRISSNFTFRSVKI
jgi:sigma-E factor negative regulatory protein RseC